MARLIQRYLRVNAISFLLGQGSGSLRHQVPNPAPYNAQKFPLLYRESAHMVLQTQAIHRTGIEFQMGVVHVHDLKLLHCKFTKELKCS